MTLFKRVIIKKKSLGVKKELYMVTHNETGELYCLYL